MKIKPALKQSILGGAIALSLLAGQAANAGLVVTIAESGNDVTATLSGAFSALPEPDSTRSFSGGAYVSPTISVFSAPGTSPVSANSYFFVTGLTSIGTGSSFTLADSQTPNFGIEISSGKLDLDQSYDPGTDSFSGVVTFADTDFDTMGLTVGTYTGTLSNDETVQIVIGSSGGGNDVPEPTTLAMIGLGSLGLAGARARRKRATSKASR